MTNISDVTICRPFATSFRIRDAGNTITIYESPNSLKVLDQFTNLPANDSVTITKTIQTKDTEASLHPSIHLTLLLSDPQFTNPTPSPYPHPPLNSISSSINQITIAKPLVFTNAEILLVPNPYTSESTILRWQSFIGKLGLRMDIYHLGLYGTFFPKGQNILEHYKGKTIIIMGNEWQNKNAVWSSILKLIDVMDIAQLIRHGTSFLISEIETSRVHTMKKWMSDIIHGTSPEAFLEGSVDSSTLVHCLRQQNHDTRYILNAQDVSVTGTWWKLADRTIKVLTKEFPARRFAVSRVDEEEKICVRESLGYHVRMAVVPECEDGFVWPAISVLPFEMRVKLLAGMFGKKGLEITDVVQYLTLSVAHDLAVEQQYGESDLLGQFLKQESGLWDAGSNDLMVSILLGIPRNGKRTDEIERFFSKHYSTEVSKLVLARLKKAKVMPLKEIRKQLASVCGLSVGAYSSRVMFSSIIGSEFREGTRMTVKDDGRLYFESAYSEHLQDLLNFPDSSLSRYTGVSCKLTIEIHLQRWWRKIGVNLCRQQDRTFYYPWNY